MSSTEQTAAPGATIAVDPVALAESIGSGAADPMSLLMAQLAGQAQDDPRMALFMRLLEQRATPQPLPQAQAPEPEPDETQQQAAAARRELNRRLRELGETVRRLYAELEDLRKRNDTLAAALGACFLCYGTDPLCQECHGHGKPGARPPEPVAYREFVLPVLRRIRQMRLAPAPQNPGAKAPPATTPSVGPGQQGAATLDAGSAPWWTTAPPVWPASPLPPQDGTIGT